MLASAIGKIFGKKIGNLNIYYIYVYIYLTNYTIISLVILYLYSKLGSLCFTRLGLRELDLLLRVGSISTLVSRLRSCEIRCRGKVAGENNPNLLWSEYVNFGSGNIRRIMALRQRKAGADGEIEPLLDGVDRSASPSRGRDELPEALGRLYLTSRITCR